MRRIRTFLFIAIVTLQSVSFAEESFFVRDSFPDFGHMPPVTKGYSGRLFLLSQDYPPPDEIDETVPKFFTIDYRKDWRAYIDGVRDYCFAGNIHGADVEGDFDVARDAKERWFHMPWQHYGPLGREGVHGLTKEASIKPRQLAWEQTSKGQTYAVAFFNRTAARTISKVWKNHTRPDDTHDAQFAPGSVVFKLLFADIPLKEVPFLNPPLRWRAYITESYDSENRAFKCVSLVQMDVMIRHSDQWVFGTFQYNGAIGRENRWENLVPVGVQWGNDPGISKHSVNLDCVATLINEELEETIINEDVNELPPTHLGWNGRLNGPVDNPMSSCFSCHAVAQMSQKSEISPLFEDKPPRPGSQEWMRWFANYRCGERFDPNVPTADFSLQLALSVRNWQNWRGEAQTWWSDLYREVSKIEGESSTDVGKTGTPTGGAPITRELVDPENSSK